MNIENLPEIIIGICLNNEGKVLIIYRKKEEKATGDIKLSWAFPGGGADFDGETREQIVSRELLEETGYQAEMVNVISERKHPDFPVYVYYVACILKSPNQAQKVSDPEVENAKWVKPEELKNYFTSNFDPKVAKYLGL